MKISIKSKSGVKLPPGALISTNITYGANGGCAVSHNRVPEPSKSNMCEPWQPKRDEIYGRLEEALHAIAQAAGADSTLEEYTAEEKAEGEDKGKGKAA